ncbi:protein SSUH2 homolog isoform X1 [Lithobates pipiens]
MEQGATESLHELGERGPPFSRNVDITEDLAREAILQYLSAKCCCHPPRSEELVINRLTKMPLYRYRLESFTESRQQEKTSKPYTGQKLDKANRGAPPELWNIGVQTPKMFQDSSERIPLPCSSELKVCHKCQGRGRCKCARCGGSGQFRCGCSGGSRQRSRNKRCHGCSGSGRRRCSKCSGRGRKACPVCRGEGRLVQSQQLSVTWRTLHSEYICNPRIPENKVPTSLLRKVTGEVVVKDSDVTVSPFHGFPESSEVLMASQKLIREHSEMCGPSNHILRQEQTVELIPVTHVQYEYRGRSLSSHVYGRERRVYAKHHTPSLSCGCAVM